MNKSIAAVAVAFACSLGTSVVAQEDANPYSDPQAAIEYRQMVHRLMDANIKDMIAMVTGQKEFDGFKLLNRGEQIDQLSQSYIEYFTVPGSIEGSNTAKDVNENLDDFKDRVRQLSMAATGLRKSLYNRDAKMGQQALNNVAIACHQCHEVYLKQQ